MKLFSMFGEILLKDNGTEESLENIDKKADGLGKKISDMGSKFALAGSAMAMGIGGLAVKASDDLNKSLNGLQASSGIADEKMGGMKDTLLAIYNDNFGESFEDIGKSMETIGQQSGLSGDALKEVTENALAMRDTFDMDVGDSFKSAKMLMDQFGISSKDAYNLIAQGAQNGLNKNGDLLDVVDEYSVQFKQLGLNSEEMFNSLSNGAKAGAFSVDVLGDGIKEFSIRAKDGSKSTSDAFTALGLDANQLSQDFGAGGEKGKAAFESVTQALGNMKDPLAQNAAGTALFGTMWEDLGPKAILALGNINGSISTTTDALKKINEVKYNSFGEALVGIKRNFETSILIPLGEKVLPILGTFSTWVTANMPQIKEHVGIATDKILSAFTFVSTFVKDTLLPRFGEIATILGELTAKYFPDTGTAGGGLGAALTSLVDTALSVLITALKFVNENAGLVKFTVEALGFAFVAYKGYVIGSTIATEALTFATNAHSIATKAVTIVQWLWNAALTANPIGLVVLAITGLIAILITLTGSWDTVTSAIKRAWEWLTNWNDTSVEDKHLDVSSNTTADGMRIGRNARGTDNWRGGLTWVGEEGPELINASKGSQIISNKESMAMASNIGGSPITVNTMIVREEADINKVAQQLFRLQQRDQRSLGVTT